MAKISGKTFDHRDALKMAGAKWNGDGKYWTLADAAVTDWMRALDGVTITTEKAIAAVATQRQTAIIEGSTAVYGDETGLLNSFTDKNPKLFGGFSSLGKLVEFIEALPIYSSANSRDTAWLRSDGNWYGTKNMTEALDFARNGWAYGSEKAKEAMEVIESDHAETKKRDYSVAGGHTNVGRLLSGNPLNMKTRTRQPSRKVITLYVELVMSAGIDQEKAIIRAAAIGAIADELENAGYSCEIIAVNSSKVYQVTVVLKRAGEALNINDLVFALGHPSMLRRLCFAFAACDFVMIGNWGSMGKTSKAFHKGDEPEAGSFYIDRLDLDNQDKVTGATFKDRVRSMFPLIVPANFPVRLA